MKVAKNALFIMIVFLMIMNRQVKGKDQEEKPNVLLIMVDDLNDYVSFMSSHPQVKTPHIDRLAESGVVFSHAYSNAPVCAPSRSSMMTGIYPHNSAKYGFSKWYENPVLKNCKTLPEYFAENGYHVAGTGKLFHHQLADLWDEWGHKKNQGPYAFNGEKLVGHPSVPEPFRSVGLLDGSFGPLSDVPAFPDDSVFWAGEAENARLVGSASIDTDCDNASGGAFVKLKGDAGNAVVFDDVQVDSGGTYKLGIHYFYDRERVLEVFVNDVSQGVKTLPAAHWCYKNVAERYSIDAELDAGNNTVKLQTANGEIGPFIDELSVFKNFGQKVTGWVYDWGMNSFHYESSTNRDLMPDEKHARWAADKIQEYDDRADKRPFFLGVGFQKPHTPMYAPKKYFDMFPVDSIKLPVIRENDNEDTWYLSAFSDNKKGPRYYQALKASYPDIETGLREFVQAYLACIAFMDAQIGLVLDALNNSGLSSNTVVVLTSDHGWNLGEKEYLFKNSPWEESARVPLIIRAPGISRAGTQVSQPVSLIDIYPTLNDLCNLEGTAMKNNQGAPLDGYSLKPFLEDPGFDQWNGPEGALSVLYGGDTKEDVYRQTYSYRTEKWRYILYHNGEEELYNHEEDPFEWNNLVGDARYNDRKDSLKNEMIDIISGDFASALNGSNHQTLEDAFHVYPNPASSLLHIEMKSQLSGDLRVNLYDMAGRCLLTDRFACGRYRQSFQIPLNGSLKEGMYLLRITSDRYAATQTIMVKG